MCNQTQSLNSDVPIVVILGHNGIQCAMSMETSSQQLTCDNNKSAAGVCHDFIASAEPENQR